MATPSSLSPPHSHHPLRTVLVGSSLSEESDRIVRSGLALARAAGARIFLVHAAPLEPLLFGLEPPGVPVLVPELIAAREEELRRQAGRAGIGEAELAGTAVKSGPPHRVITETAARIGADLVAVGATDSGPMKAALLGSTADRVVQKAACPVLLVRGELPIPPRRVLAPVDLSILSGDALRCGLDLLRQVCGEMPVAVRAIYAVGLLEVLGTEGQRK